MRVIKVDVDDQEHKFLDLLSEECCDAGYQNQNSVLGSIQSCYCC